MSESEKLTKEMEELSRLLDSINSGEYPESDHKETADLLAIATLIKKAAMPVRPPQHIMEQILEQVITPPNRPKKFKTWFHPGVLGAVASLMLLVGLNLLHPWSKELPVTPAPILNTELREITQEKPSEEKSPATTPGAAQSASKATTERPEAADKNTPATTTPPAKTPAGVTPPQPSEQMNQADTVEKKAAIIAEQSPNRYLPKSSSDRQRLRIAMTHPTDPPSETAPLFLPGKVPDSISIDKENGLVRQVYNKDTPQEIIITQHARPLKNTKPSFNTLLPIDMKDEKAVGINKVTLVIKNQEVTVEGRLSCQELQKLAESLI